MHCIECKHPKTRVLRSRPEPTSPSVVRVRLCENPACSAIFTTYEGGLNVLRSRSNPQAVRVLASQIALLPTEQLDALKDLVAGM